MLASIVAVALVLSILLFKLLYVPLQSLSKGSHSPPQLQLPVSEITRSFFGKRFELIRDGFKATSSSIYQLPLFGRQAIVLSGEESRQLFFKEKGLSIYDSFALLLGSKVAQFDPHVVTSIIKRITTMQRLDSLRSTIPSVLSTCERKTDSWGTQTILEPCSSIHELTFQAMMCNAFFEISNDPELSAQIKLLVDVIDSAENPYSTWCPWLPNMLMFRKAISAVRMFYIVRKVVNSRKSSGIRRNDIIQQMLDSGESMFEIFGFVLGLSLAGARATGTIVSWLLMQLSSHQEWSTIIQSEINTLITDHSPTNKLSTVPLQAWETKTPNLDLCLRETLRTSQPYTAMRRNNGPDLTVGGYTIPSGSLVVYPFADTSVNPAYYADPLRWDPSREAKKEFICWGAGKHGCKGQRLAMLNMKLVAVSILLKFDVVMVDGTGEKLKDAPVADWNDSVTCRPKEECGILLTRK